MFQYKLKIDGMMCGMCEAHINDAIRKDFSVKKVTSSHKKGETIILTENEIPEDDLKNTINTTGYTVTSISVEPYKKHNLFGFLSH